MDIVLEGPDNAGKSTLAGKLSASTGRQVIQSEGREKFPGEVNERVERYSFHYNVIYDRHPCVSQGIYALIKPNTPIHQDSINNFYSRQPLIIYCRPLVGRGMDGHIEKAYDEAEYLRTIEDKFDELTRLYDDWALNHAHLIYRIGDNETRLIETVRRMIDVYV